jgi:hypothetical protein
MTQTSSPVAPPEPNSEIISEATAAEMTGFSKSAFAAIRRDGRGPRYYRFGTPSRPVIRYRRTWVEQWLSGHEFGGAD